MSFKSRIITSLGNSFVPLRTNLILRNGVKRTMCDSPSPITTTKLEDLSSRIASTRSRLESLNMKLDNTNERIKTLQTFLHKNAQATEEALKNDKLDVWYENMKKEQNESFEADIQPEPEPARITKLKADIFRVPWNQVKLGIGLVVVWASLVLISGEPSMALTILCEFIGLPLVIYAIYLLVLIW